MIDPKLATAAKVFVELTGNLRPAKRGFLGTPITYFTSHTPAERMACLVAATGFSESVIEFLTIRYPENEQIFKEYRKIKDIFPEEYVLNPFIHDYILIKKYFKEVIEAHPESLKFLDPQHLPSEDYSPSILAGSFLRMFGTFELFKLLGLNTECFKYWRHYDYYGNDTLSKQSYEKALNSIGYSSKSIVRVIIQQSRVRYGTAGFLGEVLDLKYLNNVLDVRAGVLSLLEPSHKVSGSPVHPLDVFWGRLSERLSMDGIAAGVGAAAIFRFYLHQYRRWADHSDVLLMDDGAEFYSHRHGMINSYLRQTRIKIPESLSTPPSTLFKEFIVEHARNEYISLQKEYKDYVFENRDEEFRHLPTDKYRYLKTPIDLVLEGRNMNHCVGGLDYIDNCEDGSTCILHYNDGSRHGYTIELYRDLYTPEDDTYGCMLPTIANESNYYGFRVVQIKGYDNNLPSNEVSRDIILDLIHASLKMRDVPESEVKRELHKYRLANCNNFRGLRDFTTQTFQFTTETFIPFKSVSAAVSNEMVIYANTPGNVARIMHGDSSSSTIMADSEYARRWMELRDAAVNRPQERRWPAVPPHAADVDIEFTYPHRQQLLASKHIRLPKVVYAKKPSPLLEGYVVSDSAKAYHKQTGREYLIGQAFDSLAYLTGLMVNQLGNIPLPMKLGITLLTNRLRYGIMTDAEIIDTTFLISGNGICLFNSNVASLLPVPLGKLGARQIIMMERSTGYLRKGMRPIRHGDCDINFRPDGALLILHTLTTFWKPNTREFTFNFDDPFTRNLLGGYSVNIFNH